MFWKSARFNYLACTYLAGIGFFTLFRIAETVVYYLHSGVAVASAGGLLHALWTGFRFDTVVSCYILVLPLVLLAVGETAGIGRRWYYATVHYIAMSLYTVAFLACAADIPYFLYFFQRLDYASLGLTDSFGTAAGMILTEPSYGLYLLVFAAVTAVWWWLGQKLLRSMLKHLDRRLPLAWGIATAVLLLALGFVGMRGRLSGKSPIRVGTAAFCNDPFLNQIGLNPVFTFLKSMEDAGKSDNQQLELIDEPTAAAVLDEWRNMPADNAMVANAPRLPQGMNVVLVLMESMSADKTGLRSAATSLTPSLDSLMERSLCFTQAWSAGIHTHNGIYSTLYGHPALLSRQMIKHTPVPQLCGLPQQLKAAGYSTAYLMTHDEDYDNMRGFLYANGFDLVAGEHSYPRSEQVGTWGVPDHVLFDHVLEHCDSASRRGPFLAVAMTCSDHGPFILPEGIAFTPRHSDKQQRIVEYADWAIGRFMRKAAGRPWAANTLFVFVADHGAPLNPVYDMALAYNHVPLLFYAPGLIAPEATDRLAMQIDVAPTILALLGLEGPHRMLGVDLTTFRRRYAFFSADDKIGCVDGELLWLWRAKENRATLHRYREEQTEDLLSQYPERADSLRHYALGLTQASQRMLLDKTTQCNAEQCTST